MKSYNNFLYLTCDEYLMKLNITINYKKKRNKSILVCK